MIYRLLRWYVNRSTARKLPTTLAQLAELERFARRALAVGLERDFAHRLLELIEDVRPMLELAQQAFTVGHRLEADEIQNLRRLMISIDQTFTDTMVGAAQGAALARQRLGK